jgi:hypothetical protein
MDIKQKNYKYPISASGCCFCCDCYLAGLSHAHGIEGAFDYGVQKGWVRGSDAYVNNHSALINGLSSKYGTSKRGGNRVNTGGHFVIKDGKGNVIYNPA